MKTWKENWETSKENYLRWWEGKGLVISMWEHLKKKGEPHANISVPPKYKDIHQLWFDPVWRADHIHYELSRSSFKADILPVANTQLGPGSLSAILGAELEGGEDTIWIKHREDFGDEIVFDDNNPWWKLHLDLIRECKKRSEGNYFVGMPDLIEGLDTLAGLRGSESVLMDMMMRPELLELQLQKVNDIWFEVFDRIYELIQENGEMAFCYFSIWGPGKVAKLQSDISVMISEDDYRRFVQPFIREQCRKMDYTLYHLDGVDAIRHLDAILEIEELSAIQWTPGYGQPQGGDSSWYGLYRKILDHGKSIMPCWVELNELEPLLDKVGNHGLNILMHFKNEEEIDRALEICSRFR